MTEDGMARLERVMQTGFNTLAEALRETNQRLEQTNQRLEQTNQRLEQTNQRVEQSSQRLERVMMAGFDTLADLQRETNDRLEQSNQRLDGAIARLDEHEQLLVSLVGGVSSLNDRFDNFLSGAHRDEHDALRGRVERLEKHVGIDPPRS